MQERKGVTVLDVLLFAIAFVFFALNTNVINIPGGSLLRWILPVLLVISSGGSLPRLPRFIAYFIIAVLPSLFISINPSVSFQKFCAFLLMFCCSFVFFGRCSSTDELVHYLEDYAKVAVLFQIANVAYVLMGIGFDAGRALGITTNANTLGVYSNIAFWAAIISYSQGKTSVMRMIYFLVALSSIYTALLSGSRSAFVVIVINIVVYLFVRYRTSPFFIPLCLLICGGGYLLLSGALSSLNITALQRFAELGTDRDDIWEYGIEIWKQNKYFGCGYTLSNQMNHVMGLQFHNSYLSYLIECGLWGITIVGIGAIDVFLSVKNFIKFELRNAAELNMVFIVACVIVVDLALTAYGESFLFAVGSTEGFSFWFILAWVLAYTRVRQYELDNWE